jgi:holin-like protein
MLKVEQVEIASNFLLDNLAFFFIPAGVGLMSSLSIIQSYGLVLLLIVFITTVLVMGITAWIVEKMMKNIPDELD